MKKNKNRVHGFLQEYHIERKFKGYWYIFDAVNIALRDKKKMQDIYKEIADNRGLEPEIVNDEIKFTLKHSDFCGFKNGEFVEYAVKRIRREKSKLG